MNEHVIQRTLPTVRTVIQPRQPGVRQRLVECWRYRRLLRFFGKRALEKTYVRSKLGMGWILLRPLLDTGSKVLIFGALLGAPAPNNVPYLLFFMVGMAGWTLFDRALFWATRSIELNRKIVTKLYFPRILLPIACVLPGVVEFLVYSALIGVLFVAFWIADGTLYLEIGPALLLAVLGLMLGFALATGIGLFTSVMGATTRDVRFSLTYVLSFWFLITPVIYPLDALPDKFQGLAALNPMTSIVELIKYGAIGAGQLRPLSLGVSAAVIALTWICGLWFFGRAEAESIDRL